MTRKRAGFGQASSSKSDLGLDTAELARPFAVLVLLRLGLPIDAAEEALRYEGRFILQ